MARALRSAAANIFPRLLARPTGPPALLRAPLASLRPPALHAAPSHPPRRGLCTGTVEVKIPELGAESIVEGGILSLGKGVGDFVSAEEMVAEIETGTPPARTAGGPRKKNYHPNPSPKP